MARYAVRHPRVADPEQQAVNEDLLEAVNDLGQLLFYGTGVPTFTPTGPIALFLRIGGAAGTTLYVYENGAWAAK